MTPRARSNCLIHAIGMWLVSGGKVRLRKSDRWWGHFKAIWIAPDGKHAEHYGPDPAIYGDRNRIFVRPWDKPVWILFRGVVEEVDPVTGEGRECSNA